VGGSATSASVVVVTYNALPWIEQCLESVRGLETVVVDHGSSDDTVAFVCERFPDVRVVEEENGGLAFGWNTGVRETSGRYVLLLNADAWMDDGAVDELVRFADAHPRAAVVAPRLRYPDGRLQRSVRGFPSLWRIATEYLFLRKLAPRSQALNAFYAGPVTHDEPVRAEWIMGAVWLIRREAVEEVGPADDGFFLFSEETDWAWRFRDAGWEVWLDAAAGATHVLGGSHGGRMFAQNVQSQLRLLRKHRGSAYARAARWIFVAGLLLRRRFDVIREL
jgi:N-acetylglucosaminyl-diphospho-decaprenol L-rhamnosyltransferase